MKNICITSCNFFSHLPLCYSRGKIPFQVFSKQTESRTKQIININWPKKTSVQKISRPSISDFSLCFAGKFSKEGRLSSSIIYLLYNLLLTGIEGHCWKTLLWKFSRAWKWPGGISRGGRPSQDCQWFGKTVNIDLFVKRKKKRYNFSFFDESRKFALFLHTILGKLLVQAVYRTRVTHEASYGVTHCGSFVQHRSAES